MLPCCLKISKKWSAIYHWWYLLYIVIKRLWNSPPILSFLALGFLICLWILQQFSGNFAIIFYAVDIFDGINDMKDNMMDHMESMSNVSYLSAISVGAIRIVGSVLGLRNFPFFSVNL